MHVPLKVRLRPGADGPGIGVPVLWVSNSSLSGSDWELDEVPTVPNVRGDSSAECRNYIRHSGNRLTVQL